MTALRTRALDMLARQELAAQAMENAYRVFVSAAKVGKELPAMRTHALDIATDMARFVLIGC